MKTNTNKLVIWAMLAAAFCVSSFQSVSAQQCRTVRTSSPVRIYGWEQSLTNRDPSLARWDWEPMNGMASSQRSNAPAGLAVPKPGHHYVKPEHIDWPNVRQAQNESCKTDVSCRLKNSKSNSSKKVATYAAYGQNATCQNGSRIARADVTGSLLAH